LHRRLRPLGFRALALVLSLLAVLAVGEAVCRLLGVRGWAEPRANVGKRQALLPREARLPGVSLQFRPGAVWSHVYATDPRGAFDAGGRVTYRLNGHGFRGPDPAIPKPPGTRRVALLGDSFTFGAGVRFEETLGAQLQERLAGDGAGDVEVLNLAVGGWGTRDQIAYLEQRGMRFEPDVVVVVYVLNDADYVADLDLWDRFRARYESRSFRQSYLLSWIHAVLHRRALARAYIESLVARAREKQEHWDRSFRMLRLGRAVAEAGGARFAVAIYPFLYLLDERYPFAPLHERVREACDRSGIPVLDLFPAFAGRDYAELWVHPSDQHPNGEAHGIAARALAGFLRERDRG